MVLKTMQNPTKIIKMENHDCPHHLFGLICTYKRMCMIRRGGCCDVDGRRSQRPGPSFTLGSLGPSHHWRHKSWVSLRGLPYAHGVLGIPFERCATIIYLIRHTLPCMGRGFPSAFSSVERVREPV